MQLHLAAALCMSSHRVEQWNESLNPLIKVSIVLNLTSCPSVVPLPLGGIYGGIFWRGEVNVLSLMK